MPNLNDIDDVFRAVRSKITYDSDQNVFGKAEFWKSWMNEIFAGKGNIRDDCDGFALTMAEMLLAKGFDKKDVAICFCAIDQDGRPREYHLLCKVRNPEDGYWYVMDNNVTRPQRRENAGGFGWNFFWISCMYCDKPGPKNWVEDL